MLDFTVTAVTATSIRLAGAHFGEIAAGTFCLARCEPGDACTRPWEVYLRRPLFPTQIDHTPDETAVTFHLPAGDDPGYAWLRDRIPGESVDLLGPFGKGFTFDQAQPNLLLAADAERISLLLPLVDTCLDRGGRVTVLVRTRADADAALTGWLATLPFAVEARAEPAARFDAALASLLPWADRLCAAFAYHDYANMARLVRTTRLRPLPRFAQALVQTDLACGIGACLACITPLARGGHTRACIHGPVFDLLEVA